MSKTQQAIQWLQAKPGRTQQDAARAHGISQAAISAALARARRNADNCPVKREREACAAVAITYGAAHVARAILERGK